MYSGKVVKRDYLIEQCKQNTKTIAQLNEKLHAIDNADEIVKQLVEWSFSNLTVEQLKQFNAIVGKKYIESWG